MKNKSAVLFSLGLVMLMAVAVRAAPGVRGAKLVTGISVTPLVVGLSTASASSTTNFPAVVYSVTISSGAVTDFVTLFDTNSATGLNANFQNSNGYVMRLNASSATQNTQYTFDPPLQFNRGLVVGNSTAIMSSFITWEKGRQSSGY